MTIALNPMKWSDLTHIDDIKPIDDGDEAVLADIRDILLKHGAVDRFGVFLVHKHFELEPYEYVLEETDEDERVQTLTVQRGDDPDQNTIQTMWQFQQDGETAVTKCVLRCNYNRGHKAVHSKEGS